MDEMATLQSKLNDTFDMKDLGIVNHILGMRTMRDRQKQLLYLSQTEYIHKVLKHFNMEVGKIVSIPLASYVKLRLSDCPKSDAKLTNMAKVPYSSAFGSLMYTMICMRPYIAHAVGVVRCQTLAKSIGEGYHEISTW